MKKYVFCAVTLVCMLTFAFGTQAITILVDPETQESPPAGETLTVGVKIEDATDLFAYQFSLVFDNTALKFSAIQDEKFLAKDGATTFPFLTLDGQMVEFQDVTPDVALDVTSAGALKVADVRLGAATGINGTGGLVTVTFEVLEAKASTLELQNVMLADSDALSIAADVVGGTITFAPNVPPVAEAGDDQTVELGATITFDGSASRDEDGTIVSYSWAFGDENSDTGVTVSHIYGAAGVYEVTLTVTDDYGDTGSDTLTVTVTTPPNVPPVAEAGSDKSARVDEEISFDASASTDADGTIVSYSWDFGDGTTADGATVSHIYGDVGSYIVTLTVTDDFGDTGVDTLTVTVLEVLPPAIREHSPGSPMLVLQATYNEANVHGHTYIDIWSGSVPIEAGQFLEFQVAMFSGNPVFRGTVGLHTSDDSNLRDSGAKDQNDIRAHPSADLSDYARDQWYHRKISLDALAGKTLDGVMIGTDSDEHIAGMFRVYVDNIQITDGEHILTAIYIDEDAIPITGTSTATETTFAGTEGMSDYSVTIVTATPVTPRGKLISSWGSIKRE